MSSQNEAFESQPILATSIALLVPVGGLCIKGLYSLFKTDTGRHRYSILMASSAIASLMSWAGYAAYLFSNTSGAFDADSLSDASSGPIFSGLQTITELLCGAVAGIKGQSILSKYFENRWYENPHYNAVVADLEKLRGRIASLQEAYAQVTAEIREFEGTRKLAVKDMQARFSLLKSQFHFTQNTDGGDNA